ncbi:FBD-associated F-box protein At5g38590 [Linum grandiflorum]
MIEDTGIDRLSALPDDILHYILSLIHTKFSVRTSILSRRWISLWKYVPVLAFCVRWSGVTRSEHYVDRVLSLRSDSIDVNKVTVDFWSVSSRKMDILLDRITNYAASHGVQELFVRTRSRSPSLELDVIGSVCSCYRSLKVLELGETYFRNVDDGSWSCLQMLESLTLWKCWIDLGDATLTQFPRLECLKLFKCVNGGDDDSKVLKVIAPELLNLDIVLPDYYAWDLEIVTPKLQSFTF